MLKGQLSVEIPMSIPATTVWEVFSGLQTGKLITQLLGDSLGKVEVLEGDGNVGTIVKVTFVPDLEIPAGYMVEKFTKVDYENRIKECEVIEGGYKDLGLDFLGTRTEIIENDSKSSVVKVSVIYEADETFSNLTSKLSTKLLELIWKRIDKHLSDTAAST